MLKRLLGSSLRAKVVTWFCARPGQRFFVREVASLIDEDSTNVSRELVRLAKLGILSVEMEGRQKYYMVNQSSPIYPELRSLVIKTAGLGQALREAFQEDRHRVGIAFVYGSLARGEEQPGSDVDLAVIGSISGRDLSALLAGPKRVLGREVNFAVFSADEFRKRVRDQDHFVTTLLREPKLFLVGNEQHLAALIARGED